MKNLILLAVILIQSEGLIAQFKKQRSDMPSFDFIYGQKIYQNDFYSQLNTTRFYAMDQAAHFVGIGLAGSSQGAPNAKGKNAYNITGTTTLTMMVPRKITVSDSIEGKIRGFNYTASLIGLDLLHKSKSVDFLVHLGFNTGRLVTYNNDLIRQKNPYFSPKISVTPRVRIKNAVISLNVEYDYDISKTGWRRTYFAPKNMINLQNFNQSSFSAFLTLGIVIPEPDSSF